MQVLKTVFIVLVIILSVSFILENKWIIEEQHQIKYYQLTSQPIPLVVLFLGNMLLGALIVAIPSLIKNYHLKKMLKTERKKIAQIETELSSLRNMPLNEEKGSH